jgi:hypothetical protein
MKTITVIPVTGRQAGLCAADSEYNKLQFKHSDYKCRLRLNESGAGFFCLEGASQPDMCCLTRQQKLPTAVKECSPDQQNEMLQSQGRGDDVNELWLSGWGSLEKMINTQLSTEAL